MLKSLCLFLYFFCFSAWGQDYAVICNQRLQDLTPLQIKAAYLKKLTRHKGLHLVPLNLSLNDPLRKKFEKELLKINFQSLKSYWTKQHYLGKRPPISMKSQKSAQAFVYKIQGAIAYVELENVQDNVKILYQWKDD